MQETANSCCLMALHSFMTASPFVFEERGKPDFSFAYLSNFVYIICIRKKKGKTANVK